MAYNSSKIGKTTARGDAPLLNNRVPVQTKAYVSRQIWLQYFNNYLRVHRIITEEEWRKMRRLIDKS